MKKITVILLHYNQKQYIKEAIDSVLMQDYKNIEFIINDDCSSDFDKKEIEKYIKSKNNKIELVINVNKENEGIIKSINKCVKKSTGDYITFFAADDALNNEKVLSSYVNCFEKDKNIKIWTAQCLMYDVNMKQIFYEFIDKKTKKMLTGNYSENQMFSYISTGCFFAAGATVFDKKLLLDKPFDESYSMVEDWPYYISLIREGYKIGYCDHVALNHRDGGISHSTNSSRVQLYRNDLIDIYIKEIFPYFNRINFLSRFKILDSFNAVSNESYTYKTFIKTKSFRITKIIHSILRKTKNPFHKPNLAFNYFYLLTFCSLLYLFFDVSVLLKLFLYFVSIPVLFITIVTIIISMISRIINKFIYTDKKERR